MNDQELRQIVRAAIARTGVVQNPESCVQSPSGVQSPELVQSSRASEVQFVPSSVAFGDHSSHAMYMRLVNDSTACVIEEHVQCDHCGYCKSHGH